MDMSQIYFGSFVRKPLPLSIFIYIFYLPAVNGQLSSL